MLLQGYGRKRFTTEKSLLEMFPLSCSVVSENTTESSANTEETQRKN
ncbi:MAG: hypothetical protein Kow00111_26560 [Thermincola ferriacetica]